MPSSAEIIRAVMGAGNKTRLKVAEVQARKRKAEADALQDWYTRKMSLAGRFAPESIDAALGSPGSFPNISRLEKLPSEGEKTAKRDQELRVAFSQWSKERNLDAEPYENVLKSVTDAGLLGTKPADRYLLERNRIEAINLREKNFNRLMSRAAKEDFFGDPQQYARFVADAASEEAAAKIAENRLKEVLKASETAAKEIGAIDLAPDLKGLTDYEQRKKVASWAESRRLLQSKIIGESESRGLLSEIERMKLSAKRKTKLLEAVNAKRITFPEMLAAFEMLSGTGTINALPEADDNVIGNIGEEDMDIFQYAP